MEYLRDCHCKLGVMTVDTRLRKAHIAICRLSWFAKVVQAQFGRTEGRRYVSACVVELPINITRVLNRRVVLRALKLRRAPQSGEGFPWNETNRTVIATSSLIARITETISYVQDLNIWYL
jgi:hypothetical protein